jgi:5-hydroxyisourate hydrolase-like protein (transthyretin family)
MSENIRLVVIVLFFVVGGALLWNFQFRTQPATSEPTVEAPVVAKKTAIPKVDADYPDEPEKSDAKPSSPTAAQEEAIAVNTASTSKSSLPKGRGRIKGKITMTDGAVVPHDLVVSLHYIPDEARYDGSVETVIKELELQGGEKFDFTDLPMGAFVIFGDSASHTGTFNRTLTRSAAANFDREYTLSLYPATYISGTVVNTAGEPVPDAHVFVAGWLSGSTEQQADLHRSRASEVAADENGAFFMSKLQVREPVLQYRLLARAPGYAPEVTDLLATGSSNVQIMLSQGARVAGHVVNQDSGEPVPNAPLVATLDFALAASEVVTDGEGAFTLDGLTPGTLHFNVEAKNQVITPESSSLELREQEVIDDLVIHVRTGAIVAGRIYDAETDNGIVGAQINARPENIPGAERKETFADASGNFSFEGLRGGTYQVEYHNVDGYNQNRQWQDRQQIVTALGQKIDGIDFALSRGLTISGTVLDEDGAPVSGISVSAQSETTNTYDSKRVKEDGRFMVAGFRPNSSVRIRPHGNDYAGKATTIKLEETSVTDVVIPVAPAAKITATLVDSNGLPAAGKNIYAQAQVSGVSIEQGRSNSSGVVTLTGLAEGTYHLKHQISDYFNLNGDPTLETVSVSKSQHLKGLRFVIDETEMADRFTITGTITDDLGAPVSSVQVYAWSNGGGQISGRSDAEGKYTLANVPEGTLQLQYSSSKHAPMNKSFAAGTVDANVVMTRTGSLSGKVVQAGNRQPVVDFSLFLSNNGQIPRQGSTYKRYHHEDGEFTLDGAYANGKVGLMVQAEGFADINMPINGIFGGETLSGVVVLMEMEATVAGQVVDTQGNPVKNAWVFKGRVPGNSWEREQATKVTSDAQGRFELAGLARGNQVISAFKDGFAPGNLDVNISQTSSNIQVVLGDGATVSGSVLLNGNPAPNVQLYGNIGNRSGGYSDFRGETDAAGSFTIRGIPEGKGNVSANIADNGTQRSMNQQIEVAEGMNTEVVFDFKSATSSVEGYLMTSETDTTAGQVQLSISSGSNMEFRHVQVGSDGHYLFEGLPSGRISLRSFSQNTQSQKAITAELGEDEDLRLDIKLYGGTNVLVRVDNVPDQHQSMAILVPEESADHIPEEMNIAEYQTLFQVATGQAQVQDGAGTLTGVEKGSYTVVVIAFPMNTTTSEMVMQMTTETVTVTEQTEITTSVSF